MEPGDSWQIILLIALILLSSFFSASETALMTLSKIRIRHMMDEKIKGAILINNLINNSSKLLGAILVGNNIVNIGASAIATSLAVSKFGSSGVGIATGVMTILVLIFAEITPKSLAAQNSEVISLKVAKPISLIMKLLNPITIVIMFFTKSIIKLLGGKAEIKQPFFTEDELKTLVTVSHEEGVLEGEEKQMIYNVFEFGDSQAKDVMTPRTDVVAADVNATYDELIELFRAQQFSRIPIFEETYDNIIGVFYIKDLLVYNKDKADFHIRQLMREPFFTYEFKSTLILFSEMRIKRIPVAIVIDEYGGTAGIVTIEDLVEEIVGDIHDEYDDFEKEIEIIKEDEFLVDGIARIDVVNEMLGINIESEDFDSIGGFVIGLFGYLPNGGEKIEFDGIKFIIEVVDKNRIEKLRILT
ncbi:DUF21 domain-containing protein [Alkalibaculum sp. M08DMB]|uniref:DUF21 domain-containing protein n=1 Tax=Alkalibaculum sporogenes TaxID=2655001 RepID=A0A6A7KDQ6_9FIRM|nr:hemolysin family protein [Alkalibaculum sporogenes]MPW27277.1 DUF21 domain-containing protein [Alkalibaculum sporogenes]